MALQMACEKGHTYIQSDNYINWPEDAPHCPLCFREWETQRKAKEIQSARCGDCAYWGLDATCHRHSPAMCGWPKAMSYEHCGDFHPKVKDDAD